MVIVLPPILQTLNLSTSPHTHAGTLSQAGLDVVKQELLQLQLASREGGLAHPKLHQLIRIVSGWTKEGRRNRREKVGEH